VSVPAAYVGPMVRGLQMNANRAVALASAVAGMALVFAQDVFPAWAGFHTWQYTAALVLATIAVTGYALDARKGTDGEVGRRLAIASIGAVVVIVAGIASGLLGPDTETVARAPGTVAPLPDVGAAGFFPVADPATIARGDAHVQVRRRDGTSIDIGPNERRFSGTTALETTPQMAAYVEARDASGGRLTITQPTNAAFLSPVLLFPERVTIAGRSLPSDTFSTPSVRRTIKAFYFSKDEVAAAAHGMPGREAVLLVVDEDASGKLAPGGIGFVPSGSNATIGGVRFHVTVGTYPALVISAVPSPPALWIGGLLFLAGVAYACGFPPGVKVGESSKKEAAVRE
jgi:hypothetical protein